MTRIYHISYHEALKSAVLFFDGCNFNCRGCLRKSVKFDCHLDHEIKGNPKFLEVEEVLEILSKVELETVIFEGEEPTLDRSLKDICKEIDAKKILITNGYLMPPKCFDLVEVSIKAVTDEIHRFYTGRSNKKVLKNFVKLYERGDKLMVETVLIPNLVDSDEIERIASFVASVDPNIPMRIDAYWPIFDKSWRAPKDEEISKAVKIAKRYLKFVNSLTGTCEIIGNVRSLYP